MMEFLVSIYIPREIIFDMNRQHEIKISYKKAWRVREFTFDNIRGLPKESYNLLSLWCSMLEAKKSKYYDSY